MEKETDIQAEPPKGKAKPVYLKQYLVSGSKNIYDPEQPRKAAFILQTCAQNARKEFEERYGMKVLMCSQTAESDLTKEDLSRDLWKEGLNWETECASRELTPAAKEYFRMKAKAEFVQAEKRRLGISDWRSAEPGQTDAIRASVSEWEKNHPV